MGYVLIDGKEAKVFVQTGMDTTKKDAILNARALSKVLGQPVGVIVHSTEGLKKEVSEFLPKGPSIKDALNAYTYDILNQRGNSLIAMHSAGNEDARKALQVGCLLGLYYPNLSFVSLASPVSDSALRQTMAGSKAGYLGQVNDWRDPVTYSKTAGVVGVGSFVAGVSIGIFEGCAAGVGAGWLGCALGGVAGGVAGGVTGGLPGVVGFYGIKNYHPFNAYIAKPKVQSIMFDWQSRQGK